MPPRHVFMVNPAAGGGQGARMAQTLGPALERLGLSPAAYTVRLTTFPMDVQAVRELMYGACSLVAVGGDGTVSELAGVVAQAGSPCPLGVIPLGTGNDLARVTGTYNLLRRGGLEALLFALLQGRTWPLDVWRVDGRYMTNYLSMGLDAAIVAGVHERRRLGLFPTGSVLGNRAAYALCGLKRVGQRIGESRAELTLEHGGMLNLDLRGYRSLILSNIPSYGGGALCASGVRCHDGLLRATTIRSPLVLGGMFLVRYLLPWRREAYAAGLESLAVSQVVLHLSPDEFVQVDGEPRPEFAGRSLLVERAGSLRVLHVMDRCPVDKGECRVSCAQTKDDVF